MKKLSAVASIALAGFLFVGCGSSDSSKSISGVAFKNLPIASTTEAKTSVRVSEALVVTYSDGSTAEFPLEYKTLLRSGDHPSGGEYSFGEMVDEDLNPITLADGSKWVSNSVDSNSILSAGDKQYIVTHFEEAPGNLYLSTLDDVNGEVSVGKTEPINFKNVGGTVINCAGSKTNWNTHIGGEEDYSLNSAYADKNSPYYVECEKNGNTITGNDTNGEANYFCSYVKGMQLYLNDNNINVNNGYNGDKFSPYNYGYNVEVKVNEDGSTAVAKHYVTGKYTPELAQVMPDSKTFYISDDGTYKGFYKFVSDTAITEFSTNWSGRLYIAKATQTSNVDAGNFALEWIELGHSNDNAIKAIIDKDVQMSDIFKIGNPDACEAGYSLIKTDSLVHCLALREGSERSAKFASDDEVKVAAAFLETRNYGAMLGGTTEFRKEEGIAYNKEANTMYVSMSAIEKSMEDVEGDIINEIRVSKNKCGAVYELPLDSNYNATSMNSLLVGKPLVEGDADFAKYADEYYCHPDYIANPDNIVYVGANKLLIGEDTSKHLNNMLWAYDVNTKEMTRVATVPTGAEFTGLASALTYNKALIYFNAQHPMDDTFDNAKDGDSNADIIESATDADKKAYVGYIDGLPTGVFYK